MVTRWTLLYPVTSCVTQCGLMLFLVHWFTFWAFWGDYFECSSYSTSWKNYFQTKLSITVASDSYSSLTEFKLDVVFGCHSPMTLRLCILRCFSAHRHYKKGWAAVTPHLVILWPLIIITFPEVNLQHKIFLILLHKKKNQRWWAFSVTKTSSSGHFIYSILVLDVNIN